LTVIKLFAPILPYITEQIYLSLFATSEGEDSLHNSRWPIASETLLSDTADAAGEALIEVATVVRRYKSESNISLGTELKRLQLATTESATAGILQEARDDIMSVTRARQIEVTESLDSDLETIKAEGVIKVALVR
jgi:valyl-tRNA synthetase